MDLFEHSLTVRHVHMKKPDFSIIRNLLILKMNSSLPLTDLRRTGAPSRAPSSPPCCPSYAFAVGA